MKKQHGLYVNNLVGDIKANPRDFYRYINSQKKDTHGIPPLKRKMAAVWQNQSLEQADEFNGQFTDVFNKTEHTIKVYHKYQKIIQTLHKTLTGIRASYLFGL